jgi:prepilin-type N-terminal cleavage/methylation domain-containing protein
MLRRGFTLVELLVVITIILVLMALIGPAVSATRGSQKKQATQALIAKLDVIIQRQWESYSSRHVSSDRMLQTPGFKELLQQLNEPTVPEARAWARAWHIRRNIITADLPDRWSDVKYLAEMTDYLNPVSPPQLLFPAADLTAAQRAYVAIWRSRSSNPPTAQYSGAECLFMIIMQGGVAACLDCAELSSTDIGDKDGDRAPEFLDAWGNPIGFILWPAAVELPAGSGNRFFSDSRELCPPFETSSSPAVSLSPTLGMRPLIYSAGRDSEYGFNRLDDRSNLASGTNGKDCGNWKVDPWDKSAQPTEGVGVQHVLDNITNFDDEAKR